MMGLWGSKFGFESPSQRSLCNSESGGAGPLGSSRSSRPFSPLSVTANSFPSRTPLQFRPSCRPVPAPLPHNTLFLLRLRAPLGFRFQLCECRTSSLSEPRSPMTGRGRAPALAVACLAAHVSCDVLTDALSLFPTPSGTIPVAAHFESAREFGLHHETVGLVEPGGSHFLPPGPRGLWEGPGDPGTVSGCSEPAPGEARAHTTAPVLIVTLQDGYFHLR